MQNNSGAVVLYCSVLMEWGIETMKVSVYQVVPELDQKGILFRDLACAIKAGDGRIPSEIYECIYSGELPVTDPEQVFVMCNCEHSEGYKGHSLSVSDVVEFQYETGERKFFFCDSWGFPVVAFEANKAMRQISNHNYQYVQKYRRMVTVYFMTADGLQNRFCESLLFSRCRYSRSRLGYKLECQSYGSTEPQNYVFEEFPRVIVTESVAVFPEKHLYELENMENGLLRFPLDDSRNLDIVCEWLKDSNYKYEELTVQNK